MNVVARQHHDRRAIPPKRTIESQGVLKRGWRRRKTRDLPIGGHRVRDPRGADDPRVRGDEQDRRGEDADVDLHRPQELLVADAEVLDEAEDRVVRVAALLRRQPERRLVLAVDELDRHRRERDPRQREVDREDGDRHELVGVRHARTGSRTSSARLETVSTPVYASIATGTASARFDQVGATPQWTLSTSVCGSNTSTMPTTTSRSWVAKSTTARKTLSFAASWTPTMFSTDEHDHHARSRRPRPTGSRAAAPRRSRGSAGRRRPTS